MLAATMEQQASALPQIQSETESAVFHPLVLCRFSFNDTLGIEIAYQNPSTTCAAT